MGRRKISAVLLVSAVALSTMGAARPTEDEVRDPSGLSIIVRHDPAPDELPASLSDAIGAAERLAEENPDDFGYAWVDRAAGRVVLDVVSPRGTELANDLAQRFASRPVTQRPLARRTTTSMRRLEQLKHDAMDVGSEPAFRENDVWRSEVDPRSGRVILTVSHLEPRLASELVRRFGTHDVAVRVNPDRPDDAPQGRGNDSSPFYGGAAINVPASGCTDAFSLYGGSTNYMLTAGHCAPSGGSVSTREMSMGSVPSGSRESWTKGRGTVYMTGQTTYRGDIALITVSSTRSSTGRIYRGGATSTTSAPVGSMWSRRAQAGDRYCTGGSRSGEICGWTVDRARVDHRYSTGEVVRNAVVSSKRKGWCVRPGDSGAPIYTVGSNGRVAAKGIHSGGGGGGSDYYGGLFDQCYEVFTDIYEAYYGFPGVLRTQ